MDECEKLTRELKGETGHTRKRMDNVTAQIALLDELSARVNVSASRVFVGLKKLSLQ